MSIASLKQISLFSILDDQQLLIEIDSHITTTNFMAGEVIIRQGEDGDCLYMIQQGRVEVILEHPSTGTQRLAELTQGDYFGEIALLKVVKRTATVRALTDCHVLMLQRQHLQTVLEKCPALREQLEKTYTARAANHCL
ncbi:cyclic nucleotide-binding domain-containing protein [Aquaspirillum serpens]|uniref:cyclic nucleotide-binding domain-containing protein n=1 Tax=Aquaspirillum serpens TaxID=190 RepID=UPI0003B57D13|nr:cyclic nucleotide-binding domain-containing protein [Aquaspirillum serpens]